MRLCPHEAIWRAHIGRGPRQGDCILGVTHYQLSGYVALPIFEQCGEFALLRKSARRDGTGL
jgi:hypothetical protein